MKFNNELKLADYIQLVNNIASNYFDGSTYAYIPHIGELYTICAYFNNCVELEDTDEKIEKPIDDNVDEIEKLINNKTFMNEFEKAVCYYDNIGFTFGRAYSKAMDIVDYQKSDANSFANAIAGSVNAVLQSFKESFSDEKIEELTKTVNELLDKGIDSEKIVDIYSNKKTLMNQRNDVNAGSE